MRLTLTASLLALCAWSASIGNVADLVAAVRAGLKASQADAEIARTVRDARLADRVDFAAIEELQSEGAGPETVEALDRQRWLTESLPPAALHLFDAPATPSPEQQAAAIEKARTIAIAYSASLPNFLCTEMVHRYHAGTGSQNWKEDDLLKVALAYSDKGERYRLLEINGKPTSKSLNSTGDMWSSGEFGSILGLIFANESAAQFQWERWSILRGRAALVFSFRVDQAHSGYHVAWKSKGAIVGLAGKVYLDRETHQVMRLGYEAEGIPATSPILRTFCLVDYEYAEVGGQSFLLPKRADSRVVLKGGQDRNVLSFGAYRKFSGEATVTFDK